MSNTKQPDEPTPQPTNVPFAKIKNNVGKAGGSGIQQPDEIPTWAEHNLHQRIKAKAKQPDGLQPLDKILYEHCEDFTDVQHIKLRQALEAYIEQECMEARLDEHQVVSDLINEKVGVAVGNKGLKVIEVLADRENELQRRKLRGQDG